MAYRHGSARRAHEPPTLSRTLRKRVHDVFRSGSKSSSRKRFLQLEQTLSFERRWFLRVPSTARVSSSVFATAFDKNSSRSASNAPLSSTGACPRSPRLSAPSSNRFKPATALECSSSCSIVAFIDGGGDDGTDGEIVVKNKPASSSSHPPDERVRPSAPRYRALETRPSLFSDLER